MNLENPQTRILKERLKRVPGILWAWHKVKPFVRKDASFPPSTPAPRAATESPRLFSGNFQKGPLITVVVPAFGNAPYMAKCLESVLAQDNVNWECLIVDDCSTDGSDAIGTHFVRKDSRFRMIKHRANGGLGAARNTGIINAKGEYITFLDSDDILFVDSLAVRLEVLLNNHSEIVAGAYCKHRSIAPEYEEIPDVVSVKPLPVKDFISSGGNCPFVSHAPLLRTEVLRGMGGFNETLTQAEDWDLWYRTMRNGFVFLPAPFVGIGYRAKPGGMIRSNPMEHVKTAKAIHERAYRSMAGHEVIKTAPAPFLEPWSFYKEHIDFAGRVSNFAGIAATGGNTTPVDEFSSYIPGEACWAVMRHVDVIAKFQEGCNRAAGSNPNKELFRFRESGSVIRTRANLLNYLAQCPPLRLAEEKAEGAPDYLQPGWQRRVDVVFTPHKDYHVWNMSKAIPTLEEHGLSFVFVDCTTPYRDEGVRRKLEELNLPCVRHGSYVMGEFSPKIVVTMNDWDTVVKPLIEDANERGIKTVGIVEGVQDFNDADTGRYRGPYRTVSHVFLTGEHDEQFFPDSETTIIGIPRLDDLLKEESVFPRKPLVVINSNFTYNVLIEERDGWLAGIAEACEKVGVDYCISRHPADLGDFSAYKVTDMTMYDAIKNGTVFISRFGSGIIESIAMGKPSIYHNPHGEKVLKFQDSLGAYAVTDSVESLVQGILDILDNQVDPRLQAQKFLEHHAATHHKESSGVRLGMAIVQAIAGKAVSKKQKRAG